jgi:hypothetical protein
MRINKTLVLFSSIIFFTLAATAYASSPTFLSQAEKYITANCGKKKLDNQRALLCYLFDKSQEQDAAIAALNTTLSPIPSEITSLNTTQASQASQISSLQSGTGKAVHVLDAKQQDLGILIDASPGVPTVYDPTTGLLIGFEDGAFGGINAISPLARYTSTNCTGTPYFDYNYEGYLIVWGNEYAKLDTATSPTTLTIHSDSNSAGTSGCLVNQNLGQISNLLPLVQISYPYKNTVSFPLQYKYQ